MGVEHDPGAEARLRLVILLIVTGVVAALVMAGAFVELTRHLNAVGH